MGKFIANATKNKGALHRHLGVAEDQKISQDKMEAAMTSKNPTIRREASLAHTLSGFKHKKKAVKHGMSLYGKGK